MIPKGAKCADSAHFAVVLSLRQVVIAETTTVNSTGDAHAGSATVKIYDTSGALLEPAFC